MVELTFKAEIVFNPGARFVVNQKIPMNAYQIIDVIIPSNTLQSAPLEVDVLAGAITTVSFLAVLSDRYGMELSYQIGAGPFHALDQPHLFSGSGAVSMIATDTEKFFFSNTDGTMDARVQIIVGRDATPTS